MFLKCNPTVFVINDEYEILVITQKNGLISVEIGGDVYYPENSGVLYSERNFAKIRVPQSLLDKSKKYTVVYRETINRKAYFSQFGNEKRSEFNFKPLEKTDDIKAYMLADVHYRFDLAKSAMGNRLADVDFLIFNGDVGEVETVAHYEEAAAFTGELSRGELPVVFVRGNHDTRGRLAERYADYFPANGQKTYFTFKLGGLSGVALDCGEDKPDNHAEYGGGYNGEKVYNGSNAFEPYRRRELEFLKSLKVPKTDLFFAVCHICPVCATLKKGSCFDIERELYSAWNAQLERLGTRFMLCGHEHTELVLTRGDERNIIDHNYPVIVGSKCDFSDENARIWGTYITIRGGKVMFYLTSGSDERELLTL